MTTDVHAAAERPEYEIMYDDASSLPYAVMNGTEQVAACRDYQDANLILWGVTDGEEGETPSQARERRELVRQEYREGKSRPLSEFLAELTSDADAITAERLEAMGGHRHPNAELKEWAFKIASPNEFVDVFVDPEDSLWYAGLCNSRRSFVVPTPLRTMGDVRKLLIGLGYSVAKETT